MLSSSSPLKSLLQLQAAAPQPQKLGTIMPSTLASPPFLHLCINQHPRSVLCAGGFSYGSHPITYHRRGPSSVGRIACEVASLKHTENQVSSSEAETGEMEAETAKIGARVRVKVPLKVYHVPKVPEIDLTGREGELKQYVGLWKGKRVSANLPFKVEFVVDGVKGRNGPVKFFAHLKEDEFEYLC